MDDSDLKEDIAVKTDYFQSLFLTGEVGDDCEENYRGETFWTIGTQNQSGGLPKTAGSTKVALLETEKLENLVAESLECSLSPVTLDNAGDQQ